MRDEDGGPMIRLVWRTDVHLSDRAPASRKDDWTETVFSKLDQVKKVALAVGAAGVIDGGDYFHVKSPSRTTHRLVERTARHHAGYPCPVFCTPGNHDAVFGDYNHLPQQPLGVLFASRVFERLYDGHEVYFGPADTTSHRTRAYRYDRHGDGWLDGNPFSTRSGRHGTPIPIVRVVGVPYHGNRYDIGRFTSIEKGEEDHLVAVAHVLAAERGGQMFEGEDILWYRDLAAMAPDMWLLGHWHNDQGVQVINGKRFVNIGSLTRGALTQDDLKRRPAIAVLTFTDEIKVQVVRLRVKDAEEVFDIDAKVRAEARTMTLDAFVESVRTALVEERSDSIEDAVEEMDIPDRVRERAMVYWEQAG